MPLDLVISLAHGEPFVRLRLTIHNRAKNHLLSAVFPIPRSTDEDWVHTPFDVVTRRAVRPKWHPFSRTSDLVFDIAGIRNVMQSFVAAHGRAGTLYFLSKGSYEYVHERGGPLSVSLLRASDTIMDCFSMLPTERAQCMGKMTIEYAIGTARRVTRSELIRMAREFRLAPVVRQTFTSEEPTAAVRICSVFPKTWIVSTIKESAEGDRLAIRLFSLADRTKKGRVVLHLPVKSVFMARLDESPLKRLRIRDGTVPLSMRSREIATLLLER